jgi:RimJ/RimL family protein N-acetyltransferase
MSAIAAGVVARGFVDMRLRAIQALVNVENVASNRLLARLGFTRVGTLPSFRTCGGQLRDFHRYERTSTSSTA